MKPRVCHEKVSNYPWDCGQPLRLSGCGLNMLPPARQRDSQRMFGEISCSVLTKHVSDSTRRPGGHSTKSQLLFDRHACPTRRSRGELRSGSCLELHVTRTITGPCSFAYSPTRQTWLA
jgi:hypothetical protein